MSIGLINPKSVSNVGSVLRAASCFGVEKVNYTGERYHRAARFHTDTSKAKVPVTLSGVDDILGSVPLGASIVCVELAEGAQPLTQFEHPDRAYYIFGPEDGTLKQGLIDASASVVYIPTQGCLNLAATVNIVLYDRLLKKGPVDKAPNSGDDLIRQSRDINNRVKVKV